MPEYSTTISTINIGWDCSENPEDSINSDSLEKI
jgi:hypothetical protein